MLLAEKSPCCVPAPAGRNGNMISSPRNESSPAIRSKCARRNAMEYFSNVLWRFTGRRNGTGKAGFRASWIPRSPNMAAARRLRRGAFFVASAFPEHLKSYAVRLAGRARPRGSLPGNWGSILRRSEATSGCERFRWASGTDTPMRRLKRAGPRAWLEAIATIGFFAHRTARPTTTSRDASANGSARRPSRQARRRDPRHCQPGSAWAVRRSFG